MAKKSLFDRAVKAYGEADSVKEAIETDILKPDGSLHIHIEMGCFGEDIAIGTPGNIINLNKQFGLELRDHLTRIFGEPK